MKKKLISKMMVGCLVIIFLFMVLADIPVAAMEAEGRSMVTTQNYNIMLLIDKSGSMNLVDNEDKKLALSAASQFVNQLYMTYDYVASTTNISVMAFSQQTEPIIEGEKLDSKVNVDCVVSKINKIQYEPVHTGGTDLKTAVYDAAVSLQRQATEDSRNIIVMFTDGYSEFVLDVEQSMKNLENAYTTAGELQCEIFIVGLNHEDSIPGEKREEIFQIANKTQLGEGIADAAKEDTHALGRKVNYLITDNMGEVREFYGKLYAYMIGSNLEFLDNHEFSVTSSSVMEADVTVYSDAAITELEIKDPQGKVLQEDGESFFVEGDEFYRIARIWKPKKGRYTVNVKSADEHKSYVIRFYEIEIAINAIWKEHEEFKDAAVDADYIGRVIVTLMYKSEQYRDDSLADSFTVKEFTVSKGEDSEKYPLEYNDESGEFIGYFPVTDGTYHIIVELSGEEMSRTANCYLYVNPKKTVNTEKPTDSEQDASVAVDAPAERADINDEVVTMKWQYLMVFTVTVLFLIVVIWIIKNRTAYVIGDFEIYIEDTMTKFRIENGVDHPRGTKFSLWKLVEHILDDCRDDSVDEDKKMLCEMLKKEKKEISSIKLVLCVNKNKHGKKKTYKLDNGKSHLGELSRKLVVYKSASSNMQIELLFSSRF